MRALVVDDDFTGRLLLQTFLSRFGECEIAVNGKDAVKEFSIARESGRKFDLITMDIIMPEMDGQAAIRAIRGYEESSGIYSKGVKIIMTTALSEVRDVVSAFQGSCDAYLLKPIDMGKLLEALKTLGLVR